MLDWIWTYVTFQSGARLITGPPIYVRGFSPYLMASLLKNLKPIAPCLLAITVDLLGFGLVYPILTMMFGGAHRTLLGPGVSAA